MQGNGFKIFAASAFILLSLYYLFPTFQAYLNEKDLESMDETAREQYEAEHFASLQSTSERALKLGLDLQGGTRLVYSFDFDQAYEDGLLDRGESKDMVIDQTIRIIRNRIDPKGVLEPIIRRGGENRIIVELPGTLGSPKVEASSR